MPPVLLDGEFNAARTQHVPCLYPARCDAFSDAGWLAKLDGTGQLAHRLDMFGTIERFEGLLARSITSSVCALDILALTLSGILEDDVCEVEGCLGRKDRSGVAVLDQ